ncbi:MAG: dienelactone hydrolase family protein [Ardenticatenales bacterium]|nr:dienelactone hydrolase family protein [Ardenticatenales bacterium]
MSEMTFDDLWNQAMEHFQAAHYEDAYQVLTTEGARFPAQSHLVYYLHACAMARVGKTEQTVQLLDEAYQAGIWYTEQVMRQTPSFQSIQGHPAFEEIVPRFKAHQAEMERNIQPLLFIEEPEGGCTPERACPLLLALHGNGQNGDLALNDWRPIVAEGWLLAAAQSSQITAPNSFVWDEHECSIREVQAHYADLTEKYTLDPTRLLVGGFSMGGEITIEAVLSGAIPARGFIVVGPGGPYMDNSSLWEPLIEGAGGRGLRGYILMGEADRTIPQEQIRVLVEKLNAAGIPCELEVHPTLQHEFPAGFEQSLQKALAFVLRNEP